MVSGGIGRVPRYLYRVLEGSRMFQGGAHLTCVVHLDQEGGAAENTGQAAPALEAHVANKERGSESLRDSTWGQVPLAAAF